VRDALAGFLDEEVEAAHYAMRHLGFEDRWRKGPRPQIAEWPRGGVGVAWKGTTVEAHYNSGNSMSRHRNRVRDVHVRGGGAAAHPRLPEGASDR
jgi:hypothetical protein